VYSVASISAGDKKVIYISGLVPSPIKSFDRSVLSAVKMPIVFSGAVKASKGPIVSISTSFRISGHPTIPTSTERIRRSANTFFIPIPLKKYWHV
jgi:hypothetical protein